MTITDFKNYKNICDKILLYLRKNNYSSIRDVFIILKIISGFPYCLDQEGHYSYKGNFYNSIQDLPQSALNDLLYRLERGYFL